jgi:valyl-tRNA synthetase
MLGDTAVAVNPSDERYKKLIGKLLKLPLTQREIPILADEWANPEFGTGAVKVTPAHDPNDFAIGQRHPEIGSLSILDKTAHIDLPGSPFHGLDRFEARKQIVEQLESLGLLVEVKDHPMTVPVSQRSGAVIEPRLSDQWFLAVNKTPEGAGGFSPLNTPAQDRGFSPGASPRSSIAANAIAAVREGHITFTPEMYAKTYFEWMNNIHDWCISRQLWWGHRIPAWHCTCGEIIVARSTPTACPKCSNSTTLTQDPDVLDTWFSSGLLPFTVFGWPGEQGQGTREKGEEEQISAVPYPLSLVPYPSPLTPDLAAFYPTQLLVTGFDILFFWVARMIMLGCHFMLDVPMPDGSPRSLADAVPFRNVYIHALVRDADRQKMSKTKGNVIDPIEIVKKYGTDAVRFTLASQASPGTDIAFNEARTEGYRAFANKIWNAARFLQMNIDRARAAGYTISLNPNSVILSGARSAESKDPEGTRTAATAGTFSHHSPRLHPPRNPLDLLPPPHRRRRGQPLARRLPLRRGRQRRLPILLGRVLRLVPRTRQTPPQLRAPPKLCQRGERSCHPERSLAVPSRGGVEGPRRRSHRNNRLYLFHHGPHHRPHAQRPRQRLRSRAPPALALHALPHRRALARALRQRRHRRAREVHRPHPLSAGRRLPDRSRKRGANEMSTMQEVITTLRALRKHLAIPEKERVHIQLHAAPNIATIVQANTDMSASMARVSVVEIVPFPLTGDNARSTANFDVAVLYERTIDVPAERERLTKDLAKFTKGLEAAEKQLSNEGFLARAPEHIVAGLKKQQAETLALKEKAEAALAALPQA